jgi:Methyltransferase domain
MTGRRLLPGRALTPAEITDYLIDRKNASEIFSERFVQRMKALNGFVEQSGEVLEGGIFYWDRDASFAQNPPDVSLAPARRNLWRATRFKRHMLEIGVNAGHSALLALSANPDLIYSGVDINEHQYTAHCVNYLMAEFPGRVRFYAGDSREVLPSLAARPPKLDFDIFHVDGGHTSEICHADVSNCIRLARNGPGKHLLLDDINASWIFDVYCEFVSKGHLTAETFFGDWEDDNRNVLARIIGQFV